MRETSHKTTWSRLWCTLLLLLARAAWSLPVVVGILVLAPAARAEPEPCPKVMAQTPQGVAIRIGEGCDLFRVVRAHPQFDPATGRPYPMQIQLRSIYAANQDHYEDGVFVRRSVMRNCARPGKPDPNADKDELQNVCKNGDGLAYYFGIPGVKILIPSQRQLTQSESAELAQKQLDDELAAQAAAQDKRRVEQEAETRITVNAEAAAKIADLESKLEASQTAVASLRTPASRGRWFWGMVIAMLCLAIYSVGSTTVAVRARRIKPVIASGQFYPDVETASEILSGENVDLKSQLAAAQRETKAARAEVETANGRIAQLVKDAAEQSALAKKHMDALVEERRINQELSQADARLKEEGDRLNAMYLKLEVELKDRQRPSFRPPGMESEAALRAQVNGLRESVASLEGVRARQAQQLQRANTELDSMRRRIENLGRINKAIEYERDQAIQASRSAQARAAKLRLVNSLPDIVSDEDDPPTEVKGLPLVLVSDKLSAETSGDARHSVPPPPLSAETTSRQAVLKELSAFLEDSWNVRRDTSEAKGVLDKLLEAVTSVREKCATTQDRDEVAMYSARIDELERKIVAWRQTWETFCQKDQDMERVAHEHGYDEFMLRRCLWQSESSLAEQSSAIGAYSAATEELHSVMAPEDRFASLQQEMSDLRQERNTYRDAVSELASVAYTEEDANSVRTMAATDKVRHVVGTLTDICHQWLHATQQAAPSVSESGIPAATPQTISDFVRSGTVTGPQALGEFDLQAFQQSLNKAPSYLVADVAKIWVREWLYRFMREGERVYTVYTMDELYELNAFLCSPLIGGFGMDLTTTIGKALEGHKVQHACDSSCRHPSLKGTAQPKTFAQTVRPGEEGFRFGDVAASLNRG